MLRKIDAMHALYGMLTDHTCKDCPLLRGDDYHGRRYYKCKAYGDSNSEATDWRLYWNACGLFVMGLPQGHVPVIERLKHGARGCDDRPIPGQLTMFEEETDGQRSAD